MTCNDMSNVMSGLPSVIIDDWVCGSTVRADEHCNSFSATYGVTDLEWTSIRSEQFYEVRAASHVCNAIKVVQTEPNIRSQIVIIKHKNVFHFLLLHFMDWNSCRSEFTWTVVSWSVMIPLATWFLSQYLSRNTCAYQQRISLFSVEMWPIHGPVICTITIGLLNALISLYMTLTSIILDWHCFHIA